MRNCDGLASTLSRISLTLFPSKLFRFRPGSEKMLYLASPSQTDLVKCSWMDCLLPSFLDTRISHPRLVQWATWSITGKPILGNGIILKNIRSYILTSFLYANDPFLYIRSECLPHLIWISHVKHVPTLRCVIQFYTPFIPIIPTTCNLLRKQSSFSSLLL